MKIPSPNSEHALGAGHGIPGGEFAAIERIRRRLAGRFPAPREGETWIGDDAAVLIDGSGYQVLATDLTVAGVHADLEVMTLSDLGWRSMAAALSDIAAMGAAPGHAVVAVAGPSSTDLDLLYQGIGSAAESHGCPVVGGDLSSAGQLVVAVSVTGRVEDEPPPVLRSGARPGDTILVTGVLGSSAAGLRLLRTCPPAAGAGRAGGRGEHEYAPLVEAHLHPRALLEEGLVARRNGVTAMIDVSDGLSADLYHLAEASGVGAALDYVPVARGATEEEALGGGEDYQLVMTASDPGGVIRAFAEEGLAEPVRIGTCTPDSRAHTLRGEPMPRRGFEHTWSSPG